MKNKAYIIEVSPIEEVDMDYNANALPFEGSDKIGAWMMGVSSDMGKWEYQPPSLLNFLADFHWKVHEQDFIDNDLQIPIFSNRFLELIERIKSVPLEKIPVNLIDDTYFNPLFDEKGDLKPEVPHTSNFKAIKLVSFSENLFDYEKSKYDMDELFEGEIDYIEELVLKTPEEGFPPIFKIKEDIQLLLVNGVVKKRAEESGYRGFTFNEVKTE